MTIPILFLEVKMDSLTFNGKGVKRHYKKDSRFVCDLYTITYDNHESLEHLSILNAVNSEAYHVNNNYRDYDNKIQKNINFNEISDDNNGRSSNNNNCDENVKVINLHIKTNSNEYFCYHHHNRATSILMIMCVLHEGTYVLLCKMSVFCLVYS